MKATIKNIFGTVCGTLAVVSIIAAVCVCDGSEHEMAVRVGGAMAFALFTALWAYLKGGEQ